LSWSIFSKGIVMKRHVAVLMGGFSSERPVSLSSGSACATELEAQGYKVTRVDVGRDIAAVLSDLKPDVAFNALHGPFGEDGTIQGILEYLNIPYTHSGVMASALCMNKEMSKKIAKLAHVPVAESKVLSRFDIKDVHPIKPPYVVKPVNEGSSLGVVIVKENQARPSPIISSPQWHYGESVMVERYVYGRELTCAVMGDVALGVTEIIPSDQSFYDYQSKYAQGGSKHETPAKISPKIYQKIQIIALKAHKALGCRGVSRSDFRYDDRFSENGEIIWLEVNTQPGMTPTSLVPEIAQAAGHSFGELLSWIVEDASCLR
jgi:D-alanine-D-alanine ligase